jgi:hypothetical protein
MLDQAGRLLYIGKSNRVRNRVRAHLRDGPGTNFFRGWAKQVAQVEVRPAFSEMEALLIEAELIRRLRPPFNRQMRRWKGYCYLVEAGPPPGQLAVGGQPAAGRCFGPYRSRHQARAVLEVVSDHFRSALCPEPAHGERRGSLFADEGGAALCKRYYDGRCLGPCGRSDAEAAHVEALRRRDAFLLGQDDSTLQGLEEQVESATDQGDANQEIRALSRQASALRAVFRQAETLRVAERLIGGVLVLPGPGGLRKAAALTPGGLRFRVLPYDPPDAKRLWAELRRGARESQDGHVRRLSIAVVDGLCVAARHLQRCPDLYRFISPSELAETSDERLIAAAFGVRSCSATVGV